MAMTLTEALMARKAGRRAVAPGENVWVTVDVLMTHDVCGPGTIGVFEREFGAEAKVWDPRRVVIIPDHYIFTADTKSQRNVDILRAFVRRQGIPYFYDVIDEEGEDARWVFDASKGPLKRQYGSRYAGVCHTALPEKGHTRPGDVLLGTDSHTCMAGAFNEFATGIGNTDAGFVLGTGRLLLRVPPTIRFVLDGRLGPGVMAKDVILHAIGEIGFDGATYKAMEWAGEGVAGLEMDDRMTIANMAIEAGGKNGIFPCDERTRAYVDERTRANGTQTEYEPVGQDLSAPVEREIRIDLSRLEPTVALHPNPGNRRTAREVREMKVDRAYIGSCTGGKTSDFAAAARILKGRTVKVETFGVPATPTVVRELRESGDWAVLEAAGVRMTENASCAACLGGPQDSFGRLNEPMTCISATNRNFPGRMGHKEARVILASPMTVAASAVTGRVTDPRDLLD